MTASPSDWGDQSSSLRVLGFAGPADDVQRGTVSVIVGLNGATSRISQAGAVSAGAFAAVPLEGEIVATGKTFGYSVLVSDPIPLSVGERLPNGEPRMFSPADSSCSLGRVADRAVWAYVDLFLTRAWRSPTASVRNRLICALKWRAAGSNSPS